MPLVNGIEWLKHAKAGGFAIGAMNANTLEQVQAIALAAADERAPVIIQFSSNAARYMGCDSLVLGLRYAAEMGKVAAASVDVPVVLHFDHGSALDIQHALAFGFTSVMFDGSDLPFEENIARTKEVCAAAHEAGACCEAELGEVARPNVSGMEHSELTDPDQVAEFVERTGIDALAVSIGSIHALKQKQVSLDLDRLDAIRAVTGIPLVLHGSSGVLDESIRAGIRRGLCKVNVATQFNVVFTQAVRSYLEEAPLEVDPRRYLAPAREAMRAHVRERIRLFGAAGKVDRQ